MVPVGINDHDGNLRGRRPLLSADGSRRCVRLTARPPGEVSLRFTFMSIPVLRIVSMQLSRGMKYVPSPRRVRLAAETALIAPRPVRSMQGP